MRRWVACPYARHTSCGQAAALLPAFAVPLGNQPSVIFLRSGAETDQWDEMDSLPAGHLCLSGGHHISSCLAAERSGRGESVASALCFGGGGGGERGESASDESLPQVVYWLAAGRCISALVKCAVCSTYLHGNDYLCSCRSIGYHGVRRKRNGAYNEGSKVLSSVSCSGMSFIQFQIGLSLLEITFSCGWCGESEFISGHREILFLEMCVCLCVCVCVCVHTE